MSLLTRATGSIIQRDQLIIAADEKASGVDGGTFTSGAWQTRVLNTLRVNESGIASLVANQLILPHGVYECIITSPAQDVDEHMTRLQNITDGATIITGTSGHVNVPGSINASTSSHIWHCFTLLGTKTLEVQHQCATTNATVGFGSAAGFGVVETYTVARFKRILNRGRLR